MKLLSLIVEDKSVIECELAGGVAQLSAGTGSADQQFKPVRTLLDIYPYERANIEE